MAKVNERIREMRAACGFTLAEVGERIKMSAATVQRYENGDICNIPQSSVDKLAEAFGCTPVYLLGYTDNPQDTSDPKGIIHLKRVLEREFNRQNSIYLRAMENSVYPCWELARLAHTSQTALRHFLTGAAPIRTDIFETIARTLGVTSSYLMGWEGLEPVVRTDSEDCQQHPSELNDIQVAFSGHAGEGLNQNDIKMLVDLADMMRKKNLNTNVASEP